MNNKQHVLCSSFLGNIVSFLSINELASLDTAMSCKECRTTFLGELKNIFPCFVGVNGNGLRWLEKRNIKSAELRFVNNVVDDDFQCFSQERIVKLDLSGCTSISYGSIFRIGDRCPRLVEISLRDCQLIDSLCVCRLASSLPNLRILDIYNCQIQDTALFYLSDNCKSINVLSVGCSKPQRRGQITDKGVQRLAKGCHDLIFINLENRLDVTVESVYLLYKSCPKLKSVVLPCAIGQ